MPGEATALLAKTRQQSMRSKRPSFQPATHSVHALALHLFCAAMSAVRDVTCSARWQELGCDGGETPEQRNLRVFGMPPENYASAYQSASPVPPRGSTSGVRRPSQSDAAVPTAGTVRPYVVRVGFRPARAMQRVNSFRTGAELAACRRVQAALSSSDGCAEKSSEACTSSAHNVGAER
jgi:hypothetical protein